MLLRRPSLTVTGALAPEFEFAVEPEDEEDEESLATYDQIDSPPVPVAVGSPA